MMISPETYYEKHLKGKTKEQFMNAIRGLKEEIGRLKKHWKMKFLWIVFKCASEVRDLCLSF